VASLEVLSRDNLEFVKDRAIKTAYDLLVSRPEQEGPLLSLLVNKLGDPERKLASKVGYLLTKLLAQHPAMKIVVVREVERFVFRPGLTDRARYYAVVFLNQMVLTHKDSAAAGAAAAGVPTTGMGQPSVPLGGGGSLARRLVDLYFTLFKLIMEGTLGTAATLAGAARVKAAKEDAERAAKRGKKKAGATAAQSQKKKERNADEDEDDDGGAPHRTTGVETEARGGGGDRPGEMDARMLSALITGIRRAFPYVAAEEVEPLIEAHAGETRVFLVFFFFLSFS